MWLFGCGVIYILVYVGGMIRCLMWVSSLVLVMCVFVLL